MQRKVEIAQYDSLREIHILAPKTTGKEWVVLTNMVRAVLEVDGMNSKMLVDCIEIVFLKSGHTEYMLPYLDEGVCFSEASKYYGTYPMVILFKSKTWEVHTAREMDDCWEEIEGMR